MALFDENQEEVEGALTPDEVEQKLDVERKKFDEGAAKELKDAQDISDEKINELEDSITEKEEALVKEKDKEKNFSALRNKGDVKTEVIDKLTTELSELKTSINEMKGNMSGSKAETALKALTGEDEELYKKAKFHFDRFGGDPKDGVDFAQRVKDAFNLASFKKDDSGDLADAAISSSGDTPPLSTETDPKDSKLSSGGKGFIKDFGVTEAEAKKHKLI